MTFLWMLIYASLIDVLLSCDQGWMSDETVGYCYRLYTSPLKSWSESKEFCHSSKSTLAVMLGKDEQVFIKRKVLADLADINIGVWLGASQDDNGGHTWRWVDNSVMAIVPYEWKEDNPDNNGVILEGFPGSEDCLMISLEANFLGQLNDFDCDHKLPYLCKVKDTAPLSTTTTILPGGSSGDTNITNTLIPVLVSLLVLAIVGIVICGIIFLKRRVLPVKNYENTHCPEIPEHKYEDLEESDDTLDAKKPKQAAILKTSAKQVDRAQSNIYDSYDDCDDRHGKSVIEQSFGSSYCDVVIPKVKNKTESNRDLKLGQCNETLNINKLDKNRQTTTEINKISRLDAEKKLPEKKNKPLSGFNKTKRFVRITNNVNTLNLETGVNPVKARVPDQSPQKVNFKPKPIPRVELLTNKNGEDVLYDTAEYM